MSLLCVLSAAPRTPAQVRPLARRLLSMRPCADALLLLCDLPDAFSEVMPEDAPLLGKSIAQEAAMEHKSPLDACCDLLIREHCQVTMIDFMASEEDIAGILRDPYSKLVKID